MKVWKHPRTHGSPSLPLRLPPCFRLAARGPWGHNVALYSNWHPCQALTKPPLSALHPSVSGAWMVAGAPLGPLSAPMSQSRRGVGIPGLPKGEGQVASSISISPTPLNAEAAPASVPQGQGHGSGPRKASPLPCLSQPAIAPDSLGPRATFQPALSLLCDAGLWPSRAESIPLRIPYPQLIVSALTTKSE